VGLASPLASAAVSHKVPAGALITQGRVLDVNGQAASGARIRLYAEPPRAVMSRMRPGQAIRFRQVGSAVTSVSGRYAIAIRSLGALQAEANPDGIVNLEVTATVGSRSGLFVFPVQLMHAADGTLFAVSSGARRSSPVAANIRLIGLPRFSPAQPTIQCGITHLLPTYRPHWAVVGQTGAIVGGINQQFTYERGQSSNLGIGVQQASGKFSEQGTFSSSTNHTIPFPKFGGNITKNYKTEFQYGLYAQECAPNFTQVYRYWGGAQIQNIGAIEATYCAFYFKGTAPIWQTTRAATVRAGIDISEIGFSATAQTGWSVSASVQYWMGKAGHYVCGTHGPPGSDPRIVIVGAS